MRHKTITSRPGAEASLNMTPFVDIVFLLVVFFMLVCHFVVAESFDVKVPQGIQSARGTDTAGNGGTTVTLARTEEGVVWAVAAERIRFDDEETKADRLAAAIDRRLAERPAQRRVVTLRVDRETPWSQTQHLLAAVARSEHAEGVRLSVVSEWLEE